MNDISKNEEITITKTWLSNKPKKYSVFVSFLSVLFITLVSKAYWVNFYDLATFLPVSNEKIFNRYEFWRVFTATFIHSDMSHYLSNMTMLFVFSFFVYSYTSIWVYPFGAIVFSGLVNAVTVYSYPLNVKLLGASGLVYLLAGVWFSIYFLIQRQFSVSIRLLRVTGISIVLLFPTSFVPNTSYRAHFFGFIFGIILGTIYFYLNKKKIQSFEVYKHIEFES